MRPDGILACDVGTVSALAYAYPGDEPVWKHADFGGELMADPDVFWQFAAWFDEHCELYQPRFLAIESTWLPVNKGISAVRRILGLDAIAKMVARKRQIRIKEYPIKQVSLFFLGTGGLKSEEKKRRTKEMCEVTYGWKPVSLDEADALALFVFAESKLQPAIRRCVGPLFAEQGAA